MPRSSTIMLDSDESRLDRAPGGRIHGDTFPSVQLTHGPVRTFLIADIRGYMRYTEECGDQPPRGAPPGSPIWSVTRSRCAAAT